MKGRSVSWESLLLLAVALWPMPSEAWNSSLQVVQERTYRVGFFLIVDAIVENVSPVRVDWAEVSVEFDTYFDQLVSLEYTVLQPSTLGPGQRGTLRVVTPYSDAVRKIRYRFTWRQDTEQFQNRPGEEHLSWR